MIKKTSNLLFSILALSIIFFVFGLFQFSCLLFMVAILLIIPFLVIAVVLELFWKVLCALASLFQ